MFNRLKNRVLTAVNPEFQPLPSIPVPITSPHFGHSSSRPHLPDKFTYGRPQFLQLTSYDELKASADHNVRPIIVPRDISILPWSTGYAECVNSGKSEWNEDQAASQRHVLSHPSKQYPDLPYTYFGIFDGHAGYGAALAASQQFHHILHEKLVDVLDLLMPKNPAKVPDTLLPHPLLFHKTVSKDELIVGALEAAFLEMDAVLAEDRDKYRNAGGCTALVTLFIFGKVFVANAGDSRAILCQRLTRDSLKPEELSRCGETRANDKYHVFPVQFSFDHTPDTERTRLLSTAKINPKFMGMDYIPMEFAKKPMVKDLGQRILYREGSMKGWAYKTVTRDDLKMPIVTGEGKRSRLLGTIGVTRGFGDHDLRALGSGVLIKPFLSAHPEVTCRDLTKLISVPGDDNEDGEYGLLVMATDGLWDVSEIEAVSHTVFDTLDKYPTEKHRYTMVAQELVAKARGRINESGHWRLVDTKAAATVDDISVIVIPVYQYYLEYVEWEQKCFDKEATDLQAREEPKIENGHVAEEIPSSSVENGSVSEPLESVENDEDAEVDRIDAEIAEIAEQLRTNQFENKEEFVESGDAAQVGSTSPAEETSSPVEDEPQEAVSPVAAQFATLAHQGKNANRKNNKNKKKVNKDSSSPEH